jgi:hypothetical protein
MQKRKEKIRCLSVKSVKSVFQSAKNRQEKEIPNELSRRGPDKSYYLIFCLVWSRYRIPRKVSDTYFYYIKF